MGLVGKGLKEARAEGGARSALFIRCWSGVWRSQVGWYRRRGRARGGGRFACEWVWSKLSGLVCTAWRGPGAWQCEDSHHHPCLSAAPSHEVHSKAMQHSVKWGSEDHPLPLAPVPSPLPSSAALPITLCCFCLSLQPSNVFTGGSEVKAQSLSLVPFPLPSLIRPLSTACTISLYCFPLPTPPFKLQPYNVFTGGSEDHTHTLPLAPFPLFLP